jgi:hypothetical protein
VEFDLIIDDGYHSNEASLKTWKAFEPFLHKSHGVYVVEDCKCSELHSFIRENYSDYDVKFYDTSKKRPNSYMLVVTRSAPASALAPAHAPVSALAPSPAPRTSKVGSWESALRDSGQCRFQLWLDVDNVLANTLPRMQAHSNTSGDLLPSYEAYENVTSDPVLPNANRVANQFFFLGCEVHILTARGGWKRGRDSTSDWLQEHGFMFHTLTLTKNSDEKPAILKQKCSAQRPCLFVDDLRSKWHLRPVGTRTSLRGDLVQLYRKLPEITLEVFDHHGALTNNWTDISRRYLPMYSQIGAPPPPVLLARTSILAEGTLHVLREHVDRSPALQRSNSAWQLLWILKQNPKYAGKTLYEQLGIKLGEQQRRERSLGWATMLQKMPLQRNQAVGAVPGLMEMFGTKGAMCRNLRAVMTLPCFPLPAEVDAFRAEALGAAAAASGRRNNLYIFKPDKESNGKGVIVGTFSDMQSRLQLASNSPPPFGVMQRYIEDPLLTKDHKKVDFRYYVLVTSMNGANGAPRAYVNANNYVRIAGEKFVPSATDAGATILNSKKSHSSRMATAEFWRGPASQHDAKAIEANVHKELARIVAAMPQHVGCKSVKWGYGCSDVRFQLMGFDVGVDASYRAHIFEVGFDPSLKRRVGAIDRNDNAMYRDIFNLVRAGLRAEIGSSHEETQRNRRVAESGASGSWLPLNTGRA